MVCRNLSNKSQKQALITKGKAFIRLHFDYSDIVNDKLHNKSLSDKIEEAQYNTALAITDAISGTCREKL